MGVVSNITGGQLQTNIAGGQLRASSCHFIAESCTSVNCLDLSLSFTGVIKCCQHQTLQSTPPVLKQKDTPVHTCLSQTTDDPICTPLNGKKEQMLLSTLLCQAKVTPVGMHPLVQQTVCSGRPKSSELL